MKPTVVADENIVGLAPLFGSGVNLVTLPGRAIGPQDLRQADALLVRSVTPVDAALLEDSPVRFVATATSGLDHVDRDYLRQRHIDFADAAGANADSVVDYVFSVLAVMALEHGLDWLNGRIAVVGAGQVGGRLLQRLLAMGVDVRVCDPFLERDSLPPGVRCCDIDQLLDCDVVTLHTPLTREGAAPTWHLLGRERLARLQAGQLLINAARGAVVDNRALAARLTGPAPPRVVLDTWEGEPAVDMSLMDRVAVATPHIAGYSLDGKWRATRMIHEAFLRHFRLPGASGSEAGEMGDQAVPSASRILPLPVRQPADDDCQWLSRCILSAYDVRADDRRMRAMASMPPEARVSEFDRQRRDYPVRRELSHFSFAGSLDRAQAAALQALGFAPAQLR